MPRYAAPRHAEGMSNPSPDQHPDSVGWGTLPQPEDRTRTAPPAPAPGWSTLRRVLLWLVLVVGVVGAGGGGVLVVADLADTSDEWHGLMAAVGAVLGVPCLLSALLAGLALRQVRRHGAAGGRTLSLVLGAGLVLLLLMATLSPVFVAPALVGGLLVAAVVAESQAGPS